MLALNSLQIKLGGVAQLYGYLSYKHPAPASILQDASSQDALTQ